MWIVKKQNETKLWYIQYHWILRIKKEWTIDTLQYCGWFLRVSHCLKQTNLRFHTVWFHLYNIQNYRDREQSSGHLVRDEGEGQGACHYKRIAPGNFVVIEWIDLLSQLRWWLHKSTHVTKWHRTIKHLNYTNANSLVSILCYI